MSASPQKIMFLSWELPPSPSGSAVIVANLAKQFGREEMVIAGEQPRNGLSMTWRQEWPEIHHVVGHWPFRGKRLRRWLMLPLTVMRCCRLVRRHSCDVIVAVFPKEDFLLAGYLTSKLTGARLYPYFHNTYLENATGGNRLLARYLQRLVFENAECVLVMSQGMEELYRQRYPGLDCRSLLHSFNEDIPQFEPIPEPRTPFRFIISGHIHHSCLDATVRFCDAVSAVDDAEMTFLSGTPPSELKEYGLLRGGWRHLTVSRDKVIEQLKRADVVVLPHGFTGGFSPEEYQTIFPTKLIEYLICGRPILAHSPPNCFLTRFLKEHQCALVVDTASKEDLLAAIVKLRTDATLRERLVKNALATATMFHSPRVAATFRGYLSRPVKNVDREVLARQLSSPGRVTGSEDVI